MSEGGAVLDAGAFIAMERRDRHMTFFARSAVASKLPLVTSAGVVAQVWRGGGARQVPLAFLLSHTSVIDMSARVARTLGEILGRARRTDAVDAHVAFLARERGWPVVTSDPADLLAIDPTLVLEVV